MLNFIIKFIKKYWIIPAVFLICLWAIFPLFTKGLFPVHDDEQVGRLFELSVAVGGGQIPPRWVPDLGFGFGYPLFNFYPPLVYYIGYLFHVVGFSFIDSTKLVMGLGFIFSAGFMYLWVKKHYGFAAGLFAAALYTYSPYHGVDLYVRGALSEFFSFVWIPSIFWAFDNLSEKKNLGSALLAGGLLSLLLLTHNLVALQFIPFLLIYLIYLLYKERKSFKKVFLLFSLSGLISLGLSAFFWIPSIFEKKYTLVDKILLGELANYKLHFVCISQFLNSPWGYGGSIAGCADGLSFQIGKMQIGLSILAVLIVIFIVLFKKKLLMEILLPIVIILSLLFSLFMASSYSQLIWSTFGPLDYIQFPWRFLLFTAVFTSFLGGFVISFFAKYFNKYILFSALFALAVVLIYTVRFDFNPSSHLLVNDSFYTSKQDLNWRVSRMSYEYVPKGVATKVSDLGTTLLAISPNDVPYSDYQIINGEMSVKEVIKSPQYKKFNVLVKKAGFIKLNTYSFPGWVVIVDGIKVRYNDNNKLKLITFNLSVGEHNVELIFENTLVRNLANLITFLSLCFILILLYITKFVKVNISKYL